MLKNRIIVCAFVVAMLSAMFVTKGFAQGTPAASSALSNVKPSFLENKGQWDARAKYLLRAGGVDLWVTDQGVVYDLHKESHTNSKATDAFDPMASRLNPDDLTRTGHVVEMQFEHMLAAEPETLEVKPGTTNYFIGNDSTKWVTGARTFSGVTMKHIYAGVDVRFYLDNGVPRYDLIVNPGADPKSIQIKFAGQTGMKADANGNLLIETSMGNIEERGLFAYQLVDGAKQQIACKFRVTASGRVTFDVGAFDRSQPLTIDPLVYSTYLGGGADYDAGFGIAVDGSGNAYVTGWTTSPNFPVTTGAYQTIKGGNKDAFVIKLSVDGASRVYSTYLGGDEADVGQGIVVDRNGNAYVTGSTISTNFPVTTAAYQTTYGGGDYDGFLTKLSADGASRVYSTYLGGAGYDVGQGITVDSSGNAYVTGYTNSLNFPTTAGAYQIMSGGGVDAFVTKLSTDGESRVYSSYLGGTSNDFGYAIAVDGRGSAYVTGWSNSSDFPATAGAYQSTFGGSEDAFVTKLSVDGASRIYSTYLGGSSDDEGQGIAVDRRGNAYVTGFTNSLNFPATMGCFQTTNGGGYDAFVTKLSVDGASRVYSTYLGGSSVDVGQGIAVDVSGFAYVTGWSASSDFPATAGAYQNTFGGVEDAFITKLSVDGESRIYSTYLGGSSDDQAYGTAVDSRGSAYVTGRTQSTNFPATPGAYQPTHAGSVNNDDVFVTKLSPSGSGSGVAAHADVTSAGLTLRQNAPNPFSDRTTIEYSLPVSAYVTLTIYNALGQRISTLVNAREAIGSHSVDFDASHLLNGTYFYRLSAGSEAVSGKMSLFR
jgi:hypothetical protein